MTYGDKSTYDGAWIDDKKEGSGTLTYPDGDSYEGYFKDDKIHG